MALTDILRQRVDRARRTAAVDCGSLGLLTVEALPLRECALLSAGPDPDRSLLYAACRELQGSGEILRQEGRVFRPEEILQHISDGEAASAAQAVLELSGWTSPAAGDKKDNSAPRGSAPQENTAVPQPAENPGLPPSGRSVPEDTTPPPAGGLPITPSAAGPAAEHTGAAEGGALPHKDILAEKTPPAVVPPVGETPVVLHVSAPAAGTGQLSPVSRKRLLDDAVQAARPARRPAEESPLREASLHAAPAPAPDTAGSITGSPGPAVTTISKHLSSDPEAFARQLLAGLRRAAAIR